MAADALIKAVLPSVRHLVGDARVVLCLTRVETSATRPPTCKAVEILTETVPVRELLDALAFDDDTPLAVQIDGPAGVTYHLTLTMEDAS